MKTFAASNTHSLPGPDDITRVQLPNGITVLSRSGFSSPTVVIHGYVRTGGLIDPDEKLGLADFTTSALMRGTEKHSFRQIYDALESAGASLGIGAGTHTTSFHGKALVEDLGLLLELLFESLSQPVFPLEQVERLRSQILTGLAIREQDTGEMASMAFDRVVYAGHPYSRPQDGFPETINQITQEDLVAFHRNNFGPRGMVIAVVGAVDPQKAVEKVAETLGNWQNAGQAQPPPLPPLQGLNELVIEKVAIPGKSQADIVLGTAGPERRSPHFTAASLGNNILGQFGMMGRIGESVREKAGLAYYASSSLAGGLGPGAWYVSAGVDPANVDQAIELIRKEISRFITEKESADELADSQANYIGRLPLSLESNAGVANALVNIERYQLGMDYYRRYAEMIGAVTPDEILETARRYLDPDRLGIAVAGP